MARIEKADLFLRSSQPVMGLGHIGVDAEVVAAPQHPDALKLLAYWQSKNGGGGIPARASIQPNEILPLLPQIFIAEPHDSEWRYRLFGTGIAARCAVDFTGRATRRIYEPGTAEACIRMYNSVARRLQPVHLRARYLGLGIEHATMEGVQLPILGRDGRTVWVLGGVFFFPEMGQPLR